MTQIIEQIVRLEWKLFDQVQNRGGRAACQDDEQTFFIMRSSQFQAWSEPMLQSYLDDLQAACREGRNLLSEKYAYMMERTSPAEFEQIRDQLPKRTTQKETLIQEICAVHVKWLETLAMKYPYLTGQGRAIHSTQDQISSTSFETYLWGELATYSVRTLTLYVAYIRELQEQGRNLNQEILQNTAKQYGYHSLEQAEARFKGR